MKNVELPVTELFEKFLRDTEKGRRLKTDVKNKNTDPA